MGFAAWWLNLDSVAAPAPGAVGVPVETHRILGTIIQTRGNPQLRYLDDRRLRRRKRLPAHELVITRAKNVRQFAYELNMAFGPKRVNRIDGFIKTLSISKKQPMTKRALKKFDFEEFLKYTPKRGINR